MRDHRSMFDLTGKTALVVRPTLDGIGPAQAGTRRGYPGALRLVSSDVTEAAAPNKLAYPGC